VSCNGNTSSLVVGLSLFVLRCGGIVLSVSGNIAYVLIVRLAKFITGELGL